MATEKKINSRIQQKHDVAANWAKATNFIPKKGEIIIYDAEYNASGEETQPVRFKIGDGSKTVNNLPFAVIDHSSDIETLEQEVANNSNEISKIKDGTTQVASAKTSENAFLLLNSLKIIGRETVGAGDEVDEYNGRLPVVIRFDQDSFTKYVHSVASSVIELRNTGVTAGTYNNVTVDSKGRVTAGESKEYALKSDVPSKVTSVDGLSGGAISGNVSTTGSLTVGGNLTVNGTTTTVDSTTLQVKDKLIEVAHGNTTKLTTPAGLVAPKYDGTNSGALVFDGDGTAYVGDVTLDSTGNIDVSKSGLQPLATRTGLVGGNLVQYDSTAQTLKDSGKKIGDLATTSAVNAKYTKPSGGIPKTDLASDVQTSLGKADSALQSHQDISGKANLAGGNTFSGTQVVNGFLDIRGSAADKHLKTRGIGGSDGNGTSSDLYLQYSSDFKTVFGKTGNSSLNADGSVTIGGKKAATTDQIPDISGKQDKLTAGSNISISGNTISATVPTQTSQLTNDSGYATTSQIPDVSGKANLSGGNTFNGQQIFKNANTGAVAECVMNNTAYDSFTVRNISDNTKKSAISAGYVWCQDNDNVYSQFKSAGIYYGNDTAGYEGTLKFPTGISGEKTIATTDQIPTFSLSGTTLYITL